MKAKFVEIKFRASSLKIIGRANQIIEAYQARGFKLTLRQLYYQFVSRDLLPNLQTEYKRLGKIVNDGRLAGLIDWEAIEDRTRNLKRVNEWSSPAAIIDAVAEQYLEDLWKTQPAYVEVWIEKDALMGVIEGVCRANHVPYFACRGYPSQSEVYEAGRRLSKKRFKDKIILHLGDHDPSGLDMTRDLEDRLNMFAGGGVEIRRLALNMNQIEQYNPPPNPAKDTDARFEGYERQYGDSSWELDALDPTVISDLIQTEISGIVDPLAWEKAMGEEAANKARLAQVRDNWDDLVGWLEENFSDDEEGDEEDDEED